MKPTQPWLVVTVLLLLGASRKELVDPIARPLVENEYVPAIVIGIIDSDGPQVFGYGRLSDRDARVPDGNTVFEIGSISKVFTSLLLADMSVQGMVKLNDPIQKYLPDTVRLANKGRAITLLDLSTHRSGLPRLPGNLDFGDLSDPYATYTPQLLYAMLNRWEPAFAPGERAEYSNLGAGLLGHVLSRRVELTYEQLITQHIAGPLKMADTSITLSQSQQQRLAQAHDINGKVSQNWSLPDPVSGAGAIRSTANDMLRFLQAQLQPPAGAPGEAIRMTHLKRNRFDPRNEIGMGWLINQRGFLWHNGATGGYNSFAAFDPQKNLGLVVLANSTGGWSDRIGLHLLALMTGDTPTPLPPVRKSIVLDVEKLDRFTGNYFVGFSLLTIRREGDRLFALTSGQSEFRIYPESETACFWKAVDARAEFIFGPDNSEKPLRLVLHQDGKKIPSPRIPTTTPSK